MSKKMKGILSSIITTFIFLISQTFGGMIISFIYVIYSKLRFDRTDEKFIESIMNKQIVAIGGFIFAMFWILVYLKRKNKNSIEIKKYNIKKHLNFIVFGFGLQFITIIMNLIFKDVVDYSKGQNIINSITSESNIILSILLLLILAPIVEELFFRKVIFNNLRKHLSIKLAIILQAAFFSFVHLNFFQLIPTFFVGVFLGYIYYKYESIWICIYIHSYCNLFFIIQTGIDEKFNMILVFISATAFIYSLFKLKIINDFVFKN